MLSSAEYDRLVETLRSELEEAERVRKAIGAQHRQSAVWDAGFASGQAQAFAFALAILEHAGRNV